MVNEKAIIGCILGTAVGDSLGLPYEGMSPTRARKLLGSSDRYRFVFGRGMISDDTEHTCMVSQSLIESGDDVEAFARRFASRWRWWILALPAGVGKATARSCVRLWFGVGARVGKEGIPTKWISGIWEWPRSVRWMESLGTALTHAWPKSSRAPKVNPIAMISR